jgi:FkbM family methyltransferase
MNQSLKNFLRLVSPPILLSFGKAILLLLRQMVPGDSHRRKEVAALKKAFEKRNENAAEGQIVFRHGKTFSIHPESKVPFEYFCYRSPESVVEMDRFIAQTKDRMSLLDIGALHGVFSLAFTSGFSSRQAVAVDASPIAYSRLLYNVHKNNAKNVRPVECALSDSEGTLLMHYEKEHAVAAETGENSQKYISVAKRTGDELCESLGFEPDVLKIDVEGHEVKVITGLLRLLERKRPLIFLELHPDRIAQEGDRIEDLIKIFSSGGYSATLVDGRAIDLSEMSKFTDDQRMFFSSV